MSAFDIPKTSMMAKERQARVTTDTSIRTGSIIIDPKDDDQVAKAANRALRQSQFERKHKVK